MPSLDLPRLRAKARWGELGLLVGAALFALAFQARLPSRLAADADYRGVAEVLAKEAAAEDVVLLHPWWTERARLFLPERIPIVSYVDDRGDPLETYRRIWVLAEPDLPLAGNGAFQAAFHHHRSALGATRRFGNLELSLYQNDFYRPTLFSATQALETARVYLEQAGARTECPSDGRAFRCPGRDLRVAAEWHELLYQPKRCLWMHPAGGDARLVVEFGEVPAGRLRLEAGIVWEQAMVVEPSLTPLVAQAEDARSGNALAHLEVVPGTEGFLVSDGVTTQPAPVRVWTQSTNAAQREACVQLRVLGPSAAEGN